MTLSYLTEHDDGFNVILNPTPLFLFLRFNCFQYSPKHFPIPSYHHLDRTMLVLYHVSQPSILLPKKLSFIFREYFMWLANSIIFYLEKRMLY